MLARTLTKVFGGGDRHASQSGNEVDLEEIECDPQPPRRQQVEPGQWPELVRQADVVEVVDAVSLAVPSGAIDFELPLGSTMLAAYDKRSLEALVLSKPDLSVACGGPNCNEDSGWLVAGFASTGVGGTYGT